MIRRWILLSTLALVAKASWAADAPAAEPGPASEEPAAAAAVAPTEDGTPAAEEVESGAKEVARPDLLEHVVDDALELFNVDASGNTPTHYAIAAGLLLVTLLVRAWVVKLAFAALRRVSRRTPTRLDDRLGESLQGPVRLFVLVVGVLAAVSVLKLPPGVDRVLRWVSVIAYSFSVLYFVLRGLNTLLDYGADLARERQLNVVNFMPWIRRSLFLLFAIVGALLIADQLGADIRTFLTGLGIGGLAVALAAQDTLANLFGSVVVAIDQPFRLGEFVQIGPHAGIVEDVGLRSTRLRTGTKHLITIPNKTVASESIQNLSRFTQRRVEQTLRLSYDARPDQIEKLVDEIRRIIAAEREVDPGSIIVQFTELTASSLDIWVVYMTLDPDFARHLRLKQRINLAMMRAVYAHGLYFALPVQARKPAAADPISEGPSVTAAPDAPEKS